MGKKILIIVDPQYDFISGTLAVKGAEQKMLGLKWYIDSLQEGEYSKIIITADWHPRGHCSFEIWPVHCIADSQGAAIYDPLFETVYDRDDIPFDVYHKGMMKETEEYSIFASHASQPLILRDVKDKEVEQIDICGIAGDYCVFNTVQDLISLGLKDKLNILLPYTASIDGGDKLNKLIEEQQIKHRER